LRRAVVVVIVVVVVAAAALPLPVCNPTSVADHRRY